jgi:1-aminocyclopropane-1-carboxylate deaminase
MFDTHKSVLQEVRLTSLNKTNKKLFIKRDDLIDEFVSGNKWRKLKYNIEHALQLGKKGILTFGGAYSNHLLATAASCNDYGLNSVGIVRGEELGHDSNEMLLKCSELGMKLLFVSRTEYASRNESGFLQYYKSEFSEYYLVPEGGANYYGIIGCQEIMPEAGFDFDRVFIAQGTTTTSCGVLTSLKNDMRISVVPVLKGYDTLGEMKNLLLYAGFDQDWVNDLLNLVDVHSESHFGGYGKYNSTLLEFMERFYQETAIPLDPIYTGKMIHALHEYCLTTPEIAEKILIIHTGGISGGLNISRREGYVFNN